MTAPRWSNVRDDGSDRTGPLTRALVLTRKGEHAAFLAQQRAEGSPLVQPWGEGEGE